MNETNRTQSTTRVLIIVACILLCIALAVGAILLFGGKNEMPEKDELRATLEEKDLSSYSNVTSALAATGLVFDKQDVRDVELVYKYYYYKDTPPVGEHARSIVNLFLDNFYDTIDISDKDAVTTALLKCYTASVGDPYSFYYTPEEYQEYLSGLTGETAKVGIGVVVHADYLDVSITITAVLPGSPAEAAGVKKGDSVIAVDGVKIKDVGVDAILDAVAGEVGTEVTLTVLRDGEELTLTATRNTFTDVTVTYEMLEGSIGYVQVIQFKENTPDQFKKAVDKLVNEGAVGMIFDMRSNPGGLLDAVVEMIDYIAPDGQRIASFTMGKSNTTVFTSDDGHSLDLPITVLCNGSTASAGELFTAAMRDYGDWGVMKVSIVGTTTYKKGVMQTSYNLSGGTAIKLTVAFYNPPCNINYDGVGVVPNLTVEHESGKDVQLDAAITEIQRMLTELGSGL